MFCRNCGNKISSESEFCRFCGTRISSGHSIDYAIELNNKGVSYGESGKYELAIETLRMALKIAEQYDDDDLIERIVSNLLLNYIDKSANYRKIANFDDAIEILNEALGIAEKYSIKNMVKEINKILAITYNEIAMSLPEDSFSEIIENLENAISYTKEVKDSKATRVIKKNLGYVWNSYGVSLGNDGEHEQAIKYYRNALNILKGIRDAEGINMVNSNLAAAYYCNGMEYYSKREIEKAIYNLEKSLALLTLTNLEEDEWQMNSIRQRLAELYSKNNYQSQGQKKEKQKSDHKQKSQDTPNDIKELLREFELDPNGYITLTEIKSQYKIWVDLLHPDKNMNKNEKTKKHAEEKLKRINQIYIKLKEHYNS